jgi:hypothetical protein
MMAMNILAGALVVGMVAATVLQGRQQLRAKEETQQSVFEDHPDWKPEPTGPGMCQLHPQGRLWSAYGTTPAGVSWELYLYRNPNHKSNTEGRRYESSLHFVAPNLPVSRVEFMLGQGLNMKETQEFLPKIKSLQNSFLGRMATKVLDGMLKDRGFRVDEMVDFLENAKPQPVGSDKFQSTYTVLTRGTLPLERLIDAQVEQALLSAPGKGCTVTWTPRGFHVHCQASPADSVRVAGLVQAAAVGMLNNLSRLGGGSESPGDENVTEQSESDHDGG